MKMPTPEFIANTNKAVPIQTSTSADLTTAPSVPMGPPPPYPSASERYPGACAALNPLTSHEQNVGVGLGWLKSLGHRVKAFLYGKKGVEEYELHVL
ncbi:hypothetical protein C8R46DRAFT_1208105 [Mycena filopes]|nr:hypothetical protein C8R46DRAFT_1208105 [Mycena filopes]